MMLSPRQDAIEVLTKFKSFGYKIALVSDCAPDVPQIWGETQFAKLMDTAIFSCSAGMNKGDPRIFRLATAQLGVTGGACVYVADGMRQELHNAASLGMHSIQLVVPDELDDSPLRQEWHAAKISSLGDLLGLDILCLNANTQQ
jgi:putative hydrolase of the HAD superfamily